MSAHSTDTIFARASGAGKAGVALYRLSGPEAFRIARDLTGKRKLTREPGMAALKDPASGALIDKGLVFAFKGPRSFTGEDVVELTLHGSRAVEEALYDALARLGARPADAGEFTLRAFRAGKMDLAQVEALADLLDSETSLQRMQALGQLGGRLSALAEEWRAGLLQVMTPLEADIDFPDEEGVPAAVAARAGPAIAGLKSSLTMFLNQSVRARMIRDGVSIAIIGAPNAGKSSLVNALAGSDVAIVSDTPGTTRDVIETRLNLSGIAATIADTAGLRGMAGDVIEIEGMRRAKLRAESADIRVLVVDSSRIASREDVITGRDENVPRGTIDLMKSGDIIAWNKSDCGRMIKTGASDFIEIPISAKTGAGMPELIAALTEKVAGKDDAGGPALTRARHVAAVEEALAALTRAEGLIATAPELAAEDARLAARALGTITGAVGVEDVLTEIFSSFCIGK
ncbi:MAG: tRNA uridine-5-carboxymethylaminomethyl(34) synthesis GTPase MnmE [Parvularculaceae bacterium]